MRSMGLQGVIRSKLARSTLQDKAAPCPLDHVQRRARRRASVATAGKGRPASAARAASRPALRASRLVWKAISSIPPGSG